MAYYKNANSEAYSGEFAHLLSSFFLHTLQPNHFYGNLPAVRALNQVAGQKRAAFMVVYIKTQPPPESRWLCFLFPAGANHLWDIVPYAGI